MKAQTSLPGELPQISELQREFSKRGDALQVFIELVYPKGLPIAQALIAAAALDSGEQFRFNLFVRFFSRASI